MASPRETMGGQPIALYAVTDDNRLWRREPVLEDIEWILLGPTPTLTALAASYEGLFAATPSNDLLHVSFAKVGLPNAWDRIGHANDVVAMANLNGRLYCITSDGRLWTRLPVLYEIDWTPLGPPAPAPVTGLAAHAGKLIVSTDTNQLWWRDAR
jgi:hypothetical protein